MEKLRGLDLFSGIGGITLALQDWVIPVAYCEIDGYCRGVLLSRMSGGELPIAPVWDDVRTLNREHLPIRPEIIYGGFPCQDVSSGGARAGLEGKRSGLFYEIVRLADELRPEFVFLENVAGILHRGIREVSEELSRIRYDCRWGIISLKGLGAPHQRERWFLLAHAAGERRDGWWHSRGGGYILRDGPEDIEENREERGGREPQPREDGKVLSKQRRTQVDLEGGAAPEDWWAVEPDVDRVVDELPYRVDRVKALGNAVVPAQARLAFRKLMGDLI